jgi:hypothetical protein
MLSAFLISNFFVLFNPNLSLFGLNDLLSNSEYSFEKDRETLGWKQSQGQSDSNWFNPPRRQPSTGRGDSFCAIAPSADLDWLVQTWSNQPLFIWQGTVLSISLMKIGETSNLPWNPIITPEQTMILYDGEPLESGFYQVTFSYFDANENKEDSVSFPMRVISDDLNVINAVNDIDQQNLNPNDASLQRAQYFASQNLWLDVFRELEQLEILSPELRAQLDEQYEAICPSED